MGRKTTYNFQGESVPCEELEFEAVKEEWNIYQLEDGTELRVRLVIGKVVRLQEKFSPEGDPVYVFQSSNIVSTSVPPNLRKQAL